jgi:outer membrane receptor protein involved in Fe transport
VFADRTCVGVNCVAAAVPGIAYYFNADGSLFTATSQATVAGVTQRYGPQSFNGQLGGTEANPDELHCIYSTAPGVNVMPGFPATCNPSLGRVDYGRRLTSPREGFTLLGSADYNLTDHINAYSAITFASSKTETRREPSPTSGNWRVSIPFNANPSQVYLPSVAQAATGGLAIGDTLPEYRVGGKRGTNCGPTGGCTMALAFPVPAELRTLLASRPDVTLNNVNSIYNGRSVCTVHTSATADQIDPNTGLPYTICGPNSAWGLANTLGYLPPRGTSNNQTDYQLSAGLKGDLGLGDWTWDGYLSQGESRTLTDYVGYVSNANYSAIITAPNYGQGFTYSSSTSNKTFTCTSGLNPFQQAAGTLVVSQDCINALTSNQADRQSMRQFETQLNLQGGLFELPAGAVRSAVGVSWRKNTFGFTPDSLREADYPFDGPAGQFGVSSINGAVAVKEVYGELLIPLLKDLPLVRNLELGLGYRYSQYTTGQDVPTFKAELSWEPLSWVRVRGGYNRAERTPNIAELYTNPTTSSQLTTGSDPCSTLNGATLPKSNVASNPDRAQLQALCLAMINRDGGNNASQWNTTGANNFAPPPPAVVTFQGDPNLKSEKGDTWTAGIVLNSPFEHPLAQRITTTLDWYKIKISDPIDVLSSQFVMNACFNQDGSNPTYALNDPLGYCNKIVRDAVTGGITSTNTIYANIGELSVQGVDVTTRWSAALADMGLASLPGTFSVNLGANILINQDQPVTVGGALQNYAGFVGASKFRLNTVFGYNWNANRVNLTWLYRQGTAGLDANNRPSALIADYPSGSLFNLSGGTSFGPLEASVNVSNILNTKPKAAGYFVADPYAGVGFFDPYGDLVGRRYSLNLTMKF